LHPDIQASIVEQANEKGYRLVEAGYDWLLFSRSGEESRRARAALEKLDPKTVPPHFRAASSDRRYIGTTANGWKSGRMMLMRLTAMGLNYKARSEEERQAWLDELKKPITPEESAAIKALITKLSNEAQGRPTSTETKTVAEKYLDKIVTEVDEEVRQRKARSKLH
jgi:hypothetical protein